MLIELSSDGSETIYEENEYEWLAEVNLPKSTFRLAWALYLLVILQYFSQDIFETNTVPDIFGWTLVAVITFSVGTFLTLGFKEIFRSTQAA
ncbi:hypothetical protein [Paraglaciecola sp. MB-3u-78]|jgi:hypothetical protein|uniref:hypothetical protein n=1 Tax=Paraglaciecola sp. MB-3u-78 TaxID=2058332 RepID=UPI000C34F020|nr:hypothetical protein [Paraglaciecola sp. MB-3u-78]PKH00544.1 hypothetical protein CXF95_03180 [Paraglaciecola sp. MB-3u-78]